MSRVVLDAMEDYEVDCENYEPEDGWLVSGYRQDGEKWTCPDCGRVWIHVCDEAEGCMWTQQEA